MRLSEILGRVGGFLTRRLCTKSDGAAALIWNAPGFEGLWIHFHTPAGGYPGSWHLLGSRPGQIIAGAGSNAEERRSMGKRNERVHYAAQPLAACFSARQAGVFKPSGAKPG